MPEYKGYWIAIMEDTPLRWFSTIQRLDGRKMKSRLTGATFRIWENPHATISAEAAIEEAKVAIDYSGLDAVKDGGREPMIVIEYRSVEGLEMQSGADSGSQFNDAVARSRWPTNPALLWIKSKNLNALAVKREDWGR